MKTKKIRLNRELILVMNLSLLILLASIFGGCKKDDDQDDPSNKMTIALSEIFPLAVGEQWNYTNVDSSNNDGVFEVNKFTTTHEVTGTADHLGQNCFVFNIKVVDDGDIEEEDLYYYTSGDLLYESEPGELEWALEEDIQGFVDKEVGDILFEEIEFSEEDGLTLEEQDVLSIESFTESVATPAGTFENCLVLKEEKYDIYTNESGVFVKGEHSIEYTYFALGYGFIKSVDNDWELTNNITDGILLQYEEMIITDKITITLSEIFPLAVGNQWDYSNVDSSYNEGVYEVNNFTTSHEVTGTVDHLGQNSFIFNIKVDEGGVIEEEILYFYSLGDSLFESEPGAEEWEWEEDIQGFAEKQVGDILFEESETSTVDDLTLEESDVLTIESFTESVTTQAGTFENCLVLKEVKYDIFKNASGEFVLGEHSIEYTYFALGVGFIKSVDRDWEMTDETTDGTLLQYEEMILKNTNMK